MPQLKLLFILLTIFGMFGLGNARMTYISTAAYPSPATNDQIVCLINAGYLDQIFVQAYQWSNLTWWLTADVTQMKSKLQLDTNLVFSPYIYTKDSIEFVTDMYAKWLNSLPLKTVWLNVVGLPDDITCEYATSFAIKMSQKVNVYFGIYASANLWNYRFVKSCLGMSSLPLFAFPITATYFKPFAGWTKYQYVGSDNGYQYDKCRLSQLHGIQSA